MSPRMSRTDRRRRLLRRLGWITLLAGIVWDLSYHTVLFLAANSSLPPVVDVLGNLGHGITLGGIVLVILSFSMGRG